MCPGGPNHCRVGRAGSHSYFCRLNVVHCFQMIDVLLCLVVMLLLRELLMPCSSSCCDAEYNVFITLVHTHTQKKKIALVMRGLLS
jgi:hypothetical protein